MVFVWQECYENKLSVIAMMPTLNTPFLIY